MDFELLTFPCREMIKLSIHTGVYDMFPKSHFLADWNDICSGSLLSSMERGSSAVECRTRNQVSPGSNPPLVPFRRLGIFVLPINAPVDSAV